MKRNKLLWALVFIASFQYYPLWAQEAYTVVKDGTITFYYDNEKDVRTGSIFEIATEYVGNGNYPAWQSENVNKVVFDQSFENYAPTSTSRWFHSCSNITGIEGLNHLNTSAVTNMGGMFYGCSKLESLDLSSFNTSKTTNMFCMFYECSKLESLDLSSFDTQNVTNLVAMFYGCSALKELNVSSFNTENVDDMEYLFFSCSQLESLNLTSFNTEKVTNMEAMFAMCSSLKELDLSSFITTNVTNIQMMFSDCTSLVTIYVSEGWSTANITKGYLVFDNCPNLEGSEGTTYANSLITNYLYAKVDEYVSPGYFTYKPFPNGIGNISLGTLSTSKYYYTLDGKHSHYPQKGLNIINGKKMIVK